MICEEDFIPKDVNDRLSLYDARADFYNYASLSVDESKFRCNKH